MTQTDDEILAAARECGFMFDHAGGSYGMIHGFAEDVADLYRAAYAAGMEAAAVICDAEAEKHHGWRDWPATGTCVICADAIRAANGREAT